MKTTVFLFLFMFLVSPSFALEDDMVVICARLPKEAITAKTIERIYLKRKEFWEDGLRVVPVNLPTDNPLRAAFTSKAVGKPHDSLVTYWNEQHYKGISPPLVLESEEAVKRFVRGVPGAVGYIRKKNMEEGLKVIYAVEGDAGKD